ncbi:helicase HerA domain-containing protein [Actinomycetospora sp. CA-053990]|uniref:helicase HerA domain-containing protein n=1 Tax=Actinomycetospora sp. CA-053990 TaxID=3239891 RepID=UPI003D94ECF6
MSGLISGVVYSYRFLSGREMDGRRRTNATWRHRGNERTRNDLYAGRWAHLPRGARAGWRLVALAGFLGLLWGWVFRPEATWTALHVFGVLALLVFFHWLWRHLDRATVQQRWVMPLAIALAARWGISSGGDPHTWIDVPAGHRSNPERPVRVMLPLDYRERDKQQEESAKLIARKTGIPVREMDWEIDLEGPRSVLVVRAQKVPPELVGFEDAKPYLEQVTPTTLFLGLDTDSSPVWISWALDSPHLALSFGSGAGKSTVVRLLAAQTLRMGGKVIIFDIAKEGGSHGDWCRDADGELLPGIEIYRDVESGHDGLVRWAAERKRRSKARWERTGETFQRTMVVLEELNSTTPELKAYWAKIRETGEPASSPAVEAIRTIVNAGRDVDMNVIAVAQRFDAAAIGGGAVRSSFMLRVLSRFDEQARRMLIGEITDPKPKSSNHPGRMVLAVGGEATVVQGAFLTPEETVEWATNGQPQPDSASQSQASQRVLPGQVVPGAGDSADSGDSRPGRGRLSLVPTAPDELAGLPNVGRDPADTPAEQDAQPAYEAEYEAVSLRTAATDSGVGLVPLDVKALKNMRDRFKDKGFPEPIARDRQVMLYDPAALIRFVAEHEGAGVR